MGCDIHLFVEVKVEDKWGAYNHPYIKNDYRLFSKMAGVRQCTDERGINIEPISKPRGVPDNVSFVTKLAIAKCGTDGHSHSWLSSKEALEVQEWYETLFDRTRIWHPPLFGYFFGNDIGYIDKSLRDLGVKDCRIVFWFDN